MISCWPVGGFLLVVFFCWPVGNFLLACWQVLVGSFFCWLVGRFLLVCWQFLVGSFFSVGSLLMVFFSVGNFSFGDKCKEKF